MCLTSAALPINRAVIAQLMRKLGARETELMVRSWVANLAQPVFASEEQLLAAIASGDCAVGIVSSNTALPAGNTDLQTLIPDEAYADAEAMGITRHARNPDGAALLIDWLLQEDVQERHAQYMSAHPVIGAALRGPALVHVATQSCRSNQACGTRALSLAICAPVAVATHQDKKQRHTDCSRQCADRQLARRHDCARQRVGNDKQTAARQRRRRHDNAVIAAGHDAHQVWHDQSNKADDAHRRDRHALSRATRPRTRGNEIQ